MGGTVALLGMLLAACGFHSTGPLPNDLAAWAERNKDETWTNTWGAPAPPPDMPLVQFELCDKEFGIAFFDSSEHRLFLPDEEGGFVDDDVLWVAGLLSPEPHENAGVDGGFAASAEDSDLSGYRTHHGPCEVLFRR